MSRHYEAGIKSKFSGFIHTLALFHIATSAAYVNRHTNMWNRGMKRQNGS